MTTAPLARLSIRPRSIVAVLAMMLLPTAFMFETAAQSRDPKSVNGIALSEFTGYEAWQLIATSQAAKGGCGTATDGCTKAIVGNAIMIKAYRDGIPANGQPVPDGAAMAKIEWLIVKDEKAPYQVTVPGTLTEVAFMMKDAKRFPDTNGWGYATFQPDTAAGAFKPKAGHTAASFAHACHQCHTRGAKAHDFVYTAFARR